MIQPRALFSPLHISGLDFWLRAETVPGADNDTITTWTDESPAAHNATGAVGKRPLIKRNILNGRSVVRFNGIDNGMIGVHTSGTAKTMFVVAIKRSAPATEVRCLVTLGTAATNPGADAQLVATGTLVQPNYFYYSPGTDIGGTVTDPNIIAERLTDLTVLKWWMNGGAGGTLNPVDNIQSAEQYNIGWIDYPTIESPGDYDVAEVIMYTAALSTVDINRVGAYLAKFYGLTWAVAS